MILSSGPARILASGSATTFGGHPLRLSTTLDDRPVAVELAFRTDPDRAGASVDSEAIGAGYRFVCTNFTEGRGTADPVLLCETEADLAFFHFRAFRYGETIDTTVQFTFYRVAKADVGWVPG